MVKRIIITALLLSALLLGGYGCMDILPQSNESIRDEILEHLSQKYGKEFTALALDRGHTDILLCHVQGGDPKADLVHAQRVTRDTDIEYKDTYFGIIIREEIEAEIKSICSDISLPLCVFYHSNDLFYDNIFDSTKTYEDFKEWVADGNPWRYNITIAMFIDDISEGEKYAEQAFEALDIAGYHGLAFVTILPSREESNVTRVNLEDIRLSNRDQEVHFTKSIN